MKLLAVITILVVAALVLGYVRRSRNPATSMPSLSRVSTLQKPGDYRESITSGGRTRTYLLHIPAGFRANSRYPLLIAFHGGGGTGDTIMRLTGFSIVADREGFIVAYPDGINHQWNHDEDVTFVRALIAHFSGEFPIDANRVYAAGVSNGGAFSQRLACEMADVFAAIGSDVGPLTTRAAGRCNPAAPISIVGIQGDQDLFVPIQGGAVGEGAANAGALVESAEATMELWARKNGCASSPAVSTLPSQVSDGTSVTETRYSGCRNNTEVRYYIVQGMGHVWPPKPSRNPATTPTSRNINATETFWDFFVNHPKQ